MFVQSSVYDSRNGLPCCSIRKALEKRLEESISDDIIPGSSIKEVYQDYRNEALACQKQLHALTTALETEEQQLRIINTAAWQRTSIIAVAPGTVPEQQQVFFDGSCYALVHLPAFQASLLPDCICALPLEAVSVSEKDQLETPFYQVRWNEAGI